MIQFCRIAIVITLMLLGHSTAFASSGGAKHGAEAAPAPKPDRDKHKFWESWVPMLGFTATKIPGLVDQQKVSPEEGRMLVVVFIASWCEPCQQIMPDLVSLQRRYNQLNVDFAYVFMHDTREDAEGFMKEFGIESGYLANADVHKVFHNPELPTIYVGDRHKWLAARYEKTKRADLTQLDELMKMITAI
jgi:thiol-disulfide isomerase/thioredoxin